jgi:glycolate oxidase FAD binding subunit
MNINPLLTSPIRPDLESLVGVDAILSTNELSPSCQEIIRNSIASPNIPEYLLSPQTQEDLAAVVAIASQNKWTILPCGNTTKLDWGNLVKHSELLLSTQNLNRLIEHAIADLTVTVEAGMTFANLQAILAQKGQFIALDPAYPETATIGGIIATADTGSRRQRDRGVRDMLLGITFVRHDGKIAKAGGKVVKNVAGYDLMKLLTGSYGTLGIITQVTFRVYPLPAASQTVLLTGKTDALNQVTKSLLSSTLTSISLDLVSSPLIEKIGIGKEMGLLVRFQSIPESVKEQAKRLLEMGQNLGLSGNTYTDTDDTNLWQQLKQQIWSIESSSPILCKIGMLPSEAVNTLNQLQQETVLIHGGVGLGVLRLETSTPEKLLEIRRWCEAKGGFLTILKAPIELKEKIEVWGYNGNSLDLMRRLKQQFDPQNLLSPCRFIGKI